MTLNKRSPIENVQPLPTQVAVRPQRRRWWLPLLILLAAVGIATATIVTKPQPTPVKVVERAWSVRVEALKPARYAPDVTLYGRVESLWSSQLTAAVTADVVQVAVVEGDRVERNQLLVKLDDRDLRLLLAQRAAELRQAEARIASEMRRHQADSEALPREQRLLNLTRSEVRRLRGLVERKVGAQSQLDTARQAAERQAIAFSTRQQAVDEHAARLAELEGALARAVALHDQAALELERSEVRSPLNGRIARVLVAPGRRVRVGDHLLELFDTDQMLIRAQLPNRHLPRIRAALAAAEPLIANGEIDGIRVKARLRSLAAEAGSGTGGVDGLFAVTEGATQISQGRFVRLELQLPARDDLIALPHEAVYGSNRVYLVDPDNRMRAQTVVRVGELQLNDGDSRVLISAQGLPLDARVVVTQLPNALDGLLLNVVDGARE